MEPEPKSDVTKYIVGIIVIALIILGVSLIGGKKSSTSTDQAENSNSTSDQSETTNTDETTATNATVNLDTNSASKETINPATTVGKTVEISYTKENGFTPDSVSIKIGDTVKFVNKSTGDMWVASAEHPSHVAYSGTNLQTHCPDTTGTAFDQCGKGNVYSFTFMKVGTWGYHNHSRAAMKGVVVVK